MLARETANALASALTLSPAWYCATISDRCAGVVFDGAAQRLAFALRTRQAGLDTLYEQILFHLGYGSQTYLCCLDHPLNSVLAFVYLNATIESIADCRVDNFAWRDDTLLSEQARHDALPKGLRGHRNDWN
jgi:hypothetical protein